MSIPDREADPKKLPEPVPFSGDELGVEGIILSVPGIYNPTSCFFLLYSCACSGGGLTKAAMLALKAKAGD